MTHVINNHPYLGVFFLLSATVWCINATLFSITINKVEKFGKARYWKVKSLQSMSVDPEVTKQPNTISAQFYLIALLFILFDVEIIFMFPWQIKN